MNLNLPALTHEEERQLFRKYKHQNCLVSAEKIVRHHLGLVNSIAYKLRHYGLPHEDLFQEGAIGLMKAVKSFDITRENRFVSYAIVWIRSAMLEFVENNISLVRRIKSHATGKLFYNLKKHMQIDHSFSNDEIVDIAKTYNVPETDIRDMEIMLSNPDVSLDRLVDETDEDSNTYSDLLEGPKDNDYIFKRIKEDKARLIETCLEVLDDRERYVIEQRRLIDEPKGLKEIAPELGVTFQNVALIEQKAIQKMKKHFTSI